MSRPVHVVFVCSFNRARSVMAAVVLSEQLLQRGLGDAVRVSSAGTIAFDGVPIDDRAADALLQHGYTVPGNHRAAPLDREHLSADLVVAFGYHIGGVVQQRGVGSDRLRIIDVENPRRGADFEDALNAIVVAMPSVHAWVDERLPVRGEPAVGWRFWTVPPRTVDVLCAPYKGRGTPWPTTVHHATCIRDRQHAPPQPDCECGIYADLSAHDAVRRALFAVQVPTFGTRDPNAPLVVGRVALDGAIPFTPRLSGIPELRAASGQILELHVLPLRHQPNASHLVEPLADRYQVSVYCGDPTRQPPPK